MKIINQIRANWAIGGARRWIIGILGVVISCCLLSMCAGALGGGNKPAATPTVAVAARATDAPKLATTVAPTVDVQATVNAAVAATNAVKPTNTPAPTNTPRPANTPVPTATPNPSVDYMNEVASISGEIGTELGEFARLATAAGDKPSLILDADWNKKMLGQIAILKAYAGRMNALKAPPAMASADRFLKLAARDLDDSMTLHKRGIENVDGNMIKQGSAKMESMVKNLTLARAEIDKIGK